MIQCGGILGDHYQCRFFGLDKRKIQKESLYEKLMTASGFSSCHEDWFYPYIKVRALQSSHQVQER